MSINRKQWLRATLNASGIYAITHDETGRMYIGSAMKFAMRWSMHCSQLSRQKHHSRVLQRAFNKYGSSSFSFDVIEYVDDPAMLVEREQIWLDLFKPVFNINPCASSSLGVKRSDETRRLLSIVRSGRNDFTEQYRARISDGLKGRPKSEEHKRNIALAKLGKPMSEAARKSMSESAKNRRVARERDQFGRYQ